MLLAASDGQRPPELPAAGGHHRGNREQSGVLGDSRAGRPRFERRERALPADGGGDRGQDNLEFGGGRHRCQVGGIAGGRDTICLSGTYNNNLLEYKYNIYN